MNEFRKMQSEKDTLLGFCSYSSSAKTL